MSAEKDKQRSRGVRVLGLAFGVLFLVLAIAAVVIYFGWNARPEHWTQMQQRLAAMSEQERQAVSVSLRNRVMTEWSDAGTGPIRNAQDLFGHKRTITLPYDELNVWLAQEGAGLLADIGVELPPAVKAAMVDSPGEGLLRVSCDYDDGKVQQIIALTFKINIKADGTVTSTLEDAVAGTLPLPTQTAIDLVAGHGESGLMLGLLRGTPTGPVDLPIDPARAGRIVGLEVTDEAMVVTRETVPRKPANP